MPKDKIAMLGVKMLSTKNKILSGKSQFWTRYC